MVKVSKDELRRFGYIREESFLNAGPSSKAEISSYVEEMPESGGEEQDGFEEDPIERQKRRQDNIETFDATRRHEGGVEQNGNRCR
jgi:hypothetical protein